MNAKRKKKNFSLSELILLGLATVILAGGGVMHAYAKNREVELARKIDGAKKEIESYNEAVAMINVKIDRKLDRYLMKEQLLAQGSSLRPTDPGQIEPVRAQREEILITTNP